MLKDSLLKNIEELVNVKLAGAVKDLVIEAQDQIINAMNQQGIQPDLVADQSMVNTVSPYDRAVFDPQSGKWRLIDKAGYARIYEDKPSIKNWLKYDYEHRRVMSDLLGREVALNEIIHHLDGNRSNNAAENLKLLTDHLEHMRKEHPDWRRGLTGRE